MALSDKQFKFLKDINILLSFIINNGYKVTFGEAHRIEYTQKYYLEEGLTKTLDSQHCRRLAIDLNIFKTLGDGGYKYTIYKKDIQFIGDFWESLDKKNSWGGNWSFQDTIHFERRN